MSSTDIDFITRWLEIPLSPLGKGIISVLHYRDWISLSIVSKTINRHSRLLEVDQPGAKYTSGLKNWHLASRAREFLRRFVLPNTLRFETIVGGIKLELKLIQLEKVIKWLKKGSRDRVYITFKLKREDNVSIPNPFRLSVKTSLYQWIESSSHLSIFKTDLLQAIRSFDELYAYAPDPTAMFSIHGSLKSVPIHKAKSIVYDWFCVFCRNTVAYEHEETVFHNTEVATYGLLYLDKIYE